jgi:hypothetical protein
VPLGELRQALHDLGKGLLIFAHSSLQLFTDECVDDSKVGDEQGHSHVTALEIWIRLDLSQLVTVSVNQQKAAQIATDVVEKHRLETVDHSLLLFPLPVLGGFGKRFHGFSARAGVGKPQRMKRAPFVIAFLL